MRFRAERLRRRPRARTLRARLARITAIAVFLAVTTAGGVAFTAAAGVLMGQVDHELRSGPEALAGPGALAGPLRRAGALATDSLQPTCLALRAGPGASAGASRSPDGPSGTIVELADPGGEVCLPAGSRRSGLSPATRSAASGSREGTISTVRSSDGVPLRVLVTSLGGGWTLTVGRDVSGPIEVIDRLRGILFGLGALGALAALGAGWLVARTGLRPIGALAEAAEHIARTQDLTVRIDVGGPGGTDEVTRLAVAFDRMTAALLTARQRQAQLVADAGHELRTPLTSLRTNLDLLLRSEAAGRPLPAGSRSALMDDVRSQLEELTQLIDEVMVLSHDHPPPSREPVQLEEVVRRALIRVGPRSGGHDVRTALEPWTVPAADPVGLERAVVNVLDNALKFAPVGSTVRVTLVQGRLTVDDEGPGVPEADREHVFERFWRSPRARSVRGSGLGLAIVADTALAHGGAAAMGEAPGGGARVTLDLPGKVLPAAQVPSPQARAEVEAAVEVEAALGVVENA